MPELEQTDLFAMLKSKTAMVHEKFMHESRAQRVLASDCNRSEYFELLQKHSGFYLPLENLPLALPSLVFNRSQAKHRLLAEDFIFLKTAHRFGDLICARLPKIDELLSALGICYVLEGATWGGQTIAQLLKLSLSLKKQEGLKFFTCYGPETGKMRNEFKIQTQDIVRTLEEFSAMFEAALNTFNSLSEWMEAS